MKTRSIIGKRIARVYQNRFWNAHSEQFDISLEAIELDDGSFIRFDTFDTIDVPAPYAIHPGRAPSETECNLVTPKRKQ